MCFCSKQKTAYEMRISDWSADVCSSDLATPKGAVKQMKRFTVSGIFEAGYQEYDKGLAGVNIHDVQRLMRMGDGVTGVRLRMHDMDLAWEVARDLAQRLKGPYLVSDWTRDNANMFREIGRAHV